MKRAGNIAVVLLGLVLVVSCRPGKAPNVPPRTKIALPKVVTGANLRAVGDERRGYGTPKARETLSRLKSLNVNTVAILMEGYLENLESVDIEIPNRSHLARIEAALVDANRMGFSTILIPHLYLRDGGWRGHITMSDPQIRDRWWGSYTRFIEEAARISERSGATVLSLGVELKGMSAELDTRTRFRVLRQKVQKIYSGLLTYSANWDEAESVKFWDLVDIVGVNGYYPLVPDVERGSEAIAQRLHELHQSTRKQVLILEVGYRSGPMSHLKPWDWPEDVANKEVDEAAQAKNWAAILTNWLTTEGIRGLLVWVIPTDPDDPASEPPHGFNPLNKAAEQVLKRAFSAYASDEG